MTWLSLGACGLLSIVCVLLVRNVRGQRKALRTRVVDRPSPRPTFFGEIRAAYNIAMTAPPKHPPKPPKPPRPDVEAEQRPPPSGPRATAPLVDLAAPDDAPANDVPPLDRGTPSVPPSVEGADARVERRFRELVAEAHHHGRVAEHCHHHTCLSRGMPTGECPCMCEPCARMGILWRKAVRDVGRKG